jgi:cytochrome c biogenesis protein ResB
MSKLKRMLMWAGLVLILLLIFLSVYGAFIGAAKAQDFFSSLPLTVYWLVLILVLIAGIIAFRRLIRVPGLLLIHLGCALVLAGGIWGSEAVGKLRDKLFSTDTIRAGRMAIFEGDVENRVTLQSSDQVKQLPFHVELKDFRLEYYEPGSLLIQSRQGEHWKIPAEAGAEFFLGDDIGKLKIKKIFENFKIKIEGDEHTAYDAVGTGSNPAVEVQIESPDGEVTTKYVFERFPGHVRHEDKIALRYQRVVREYISELQIIQDDEVVAEKIIQVNDPLHFGGYHFYQNSYDAEAGRYTILMVVSDTGLNLIYGGYIMLCVGVFWHFWLRHLFVAVKAKLA